MNIESHINSGNLRALRPVLEQWQQLTYEFLKYCEYEDNSWFYNERASLSILAAAAWCANGVAMEEFVTKKRKDNSDRSGRCDIYIGLTAKEYNCEAKQAFCPISSGTRNGVSNATNKLDEAVEDASALNKDEAERLAICFAVPYFYKMIRIWKGSLRTGKGRYIPWGSHANKKPGWVICKIHL